MKKFFMAAVLTISMLLNTCFAMELDEFSLGNLELNTPYNDVIKAYGQPTSHPGGWAQLVTDVIKYGNGVEIGFCGKKVRYIAVTENNGWKTPSGVRVGMSIDKVIELYGKNYKTVNRANPIDPTKEYFYYKWSGTSYSWAEIADVYTYQQGDTKYILSVIVNNGIVTAIEISQQTPEN
jgi:hypothetical protein